MEASPGDTIKPRREDGWLLLARNTTYCEPGFYPLLYYNARDGRIRAFLYNLDVTDAATAYRLEVSLLDSDGSQLQGAIFPVDPDPRRWDKAILPIPFWQKGQWTMVEFPVLYPMIYPRGDERRFLSLRVPDLSGYYSLSESQYRAGHQDVRLRLKVVPLLTLAVYGSGVGSAIGEAIQELGPRNFLDYLKGLIESARQGVSIYKSINDFSKKVQDYLREREQSGQIDEFSSNVLTMISRSATYLPPYLAAAGFAVSLYDKLFSDPEPIRMSLTLDIALGFHAVAEGELQARQSYFYMPGRFSISEAFGTSLGRDNYGIIESVIPRYERPVGLFGFCCSAAAAIIMRRDLPRKEQTSNSAVFLFPYRGEFGAVDMPFTGGNFDPPAGWREPDPSPKPKTASSFTLPGFLPVVYNGYADITPLANGDSRGNSQLYCSIVLCDDGEEY